MYLKTVALSIYHSVAPSVKNPKKYFILKKEEKHASVFEHIL